MTSSDISEAIKEYATKYPHLIDLKQAAEIGHVTLATVYDWSSRGLFDSFKSKPGRHALLIRDAFVQFVMTHNSNERMRAAS